MPLRLVLKNWRSIESASIEIAPFTVIVGRNSTGKSNVVDALLFITEVETDATTAVTRRGGIASIRRWGPSKPFDVYVGVEVERGPSHASHVIQLKSLREGAWLIGAEEIEFRSAGAQTVQLKRDKDGTFSGSPAPPSLLTLASTASGFPWARNVAAGATHRPLALLPLRVQKIRPEPEEMRRPQPPGVTPRLIEDGSNITTALHQMAPEGRRRVVEAMRSIVPGLTDVRAEPAGRYLALAFTQEHAPLRRPDFAGTEMSDGALRALGVIVAAQQMRRNDVLIIEEPEVNLHPGAAAVVYDVLHEASRRGTVLITTHSPELLERAQDDEILVCEYVDGVTRVGRLSDGQRSVIREGLFTAAELMRTEELRREGAEPRVVPE